MPYEGICPECGGYMYSPDQHGSDYIECDTCHLIKREDGTIDRSEMDLPCEGRQDCENCIYYGRSSDAPDTVEKDCLYSPDFDSKNNE